MDNMGAELIQRPPNKLPNSLQRAVQNEGRRERGRFTAQDENVAKFCTHKYDTEYSGGKASELPNNADGRQQYIAKRVDVKSVFKWRTGRQCEGYASADDSTVCRLKAVQTEAVHSRLERLNPFLYIRRRNDNFACILIYVDDMLIVTQTKEKFKQVQANLEESGSKFYHHIGYRAKSR